MRAVDGLAPAGMDVGRRNGRGGQKAQKAAAVRWW